VGGGRMVKHPQHSLDLAFEIPICGLDNHEVSNGGGSKWFPSDYDFVLAHIWKKSKIYRRYYMEQKRQGRTVYLDNSAFELGRSAPLDLLKSIMSRLKPDVVVAPDVRGECMETVEHTIAFINDEDVQHILSTQGIEVMAVLQGKSEANFLFALDTFLKEPLITKIGISYGWIDRLSFLERHRDKFIKPVHILGLPRLFEVIGLNKLPFVESLDTSLPINSAICGAKFSKYEWDNQRVKGYINTLMKEKTMRDCYKNIEFLYSLIGREF
jgi:hypothetical protein